MPLSSSFLSSTVCARKVTLYWRRSGRPCYTGRFIKKMAYPPFLFPHGVSHAGGRSASDFSMNSILSGRAPGAPSHVHPPNPFFPHMNPFHPAMHGFPNPFFPHHFPPGVPNPANPLAGGGPMEFGGHTRPVRAIEPGQDDVEDDPKVELDQNDLWSEFHNIGTEMGKGKRFYLEQMLMWILFFSSLDYSHHQKWQVSTNSLLSPRKTAVWWNSGVDTIFLSWLVCSAAFLQIVDAGFCQILANIFFTGIQKLLQETVIYYHTVDRAVWRKW